MDHGVTSIWHRFHPPLLRFAFQPIVSLATASIVGYEFLARPATAEGEPIPPETLFRWAVESQETTALDRFMIEAALGEAQRRPGGLVFINILPHSLPYLESFLLTQQLVPPTSVVLELVEETSAGGNLASWLATIRRAGYRVAVDDVGAGYSSLARLAEVHPDLAKVDLSLVRGIDRDTVKYSLVEATVHFARRAGIALVGEGAETPAELAVLQELGLDYAQGYLIGRPHTEYQEEPAIRLPELRTRQVPPPDQLVASLVRMVQYTSRGMGHGEGSAEALVQLAAQLTGADVAGLVRFNEPQWQWVAEMGMGRPTIRPEWRRAVERPLTEGPVTWQEPGPHAFPAKSGVAAPLVADGHLTGALVVGFAQPHQVRPHLVDLVGGLAALFGLGRLVQPGQEGLDVSSAALLEVAHSVAAESGKTPEALLARILTVATTVTGSHTGLIGVVTGQELRTIDPDGVRDERPLADLLNPAVEAGRSLSGQVLQSRQAIMVDDVRTDPNLDAERQSMLSAGILSVASVPMVASGAVLGLLTVCHSQARAFAGPKQRMLLAELASLAAALVQRIEADQQQAKAMARDALVARGHASLSREAVPELAARALAETVLELSDARLVLIAVPRDGTFVPVTAIGPAQGFLENWHRAAAPGGDQIPNALQMALEGGHTVVLAPGAGEIPRPLYRPPDAEVLGLDWLLASPISALGRPMGVLAVYGQGDAPEPAIIEAAEQLSHTAGAILLAIELGGKAPSR